MVSKLVVGNVANDSGVISLDTLQDWLSKTTDSVNQMIELYNHQMAFMQFSRVMLILIAVLLGILIILMLFSLFSKD